MCGRYRLSRRKELRERFDACGEYDDAPRYNMWNDYIIKFTPPTSEEIKNARPLATVLPHDALTHAVLIAATLCAGTEGDRAVS